MHLTHKWIKERELISHTPNWLSDFFTKNDVKQLLIDIKTGNEHHFLQTLILGICRINKSQCKIFLWKELYPMFQWLLTIFEVEMKWIHTSLTFSQKILGILTWTLQEKEKNKNASRNMLERCILLRNHFDRLRDKEFPPEEISNLFSEHIEELKKIVQYHILKKDANIIYVNFNSIL